MFLALFTIVYSTLPYVFKFFLDILLSFILMFFFLILAAVQITGRTSFDIKLTKLQSDDL